MIVEDWNGKDLPMSDWEVSYKIDGVRCHFVDGKKLSRRNKPLYNIPDPHKGVEVAEIFCGSFKETMEVVKTFKKAMPLPLWRVFALRPKIDDRLLVCAFKNETLTVKEINDLYTKARKKGYEGIVIRNLRTEISYRKKPVETVDVKITGFTLGKGRLEGKLGAFITERGKVGAGLTDKIRNEFTPDIVGKTIEVSFMELTESGKFRQPRFVRFRPDKD